MKNNFILFVIAICLLIFSNIFYSNRLINYDVVNDVEEVQNVFREKETTAKLFLDDIISKIDKSGIDVIYQEEFLKETQSVFDKYKISLFIADDEEILFWSDNSIPITSYQLPNQIHGMDDIRNGYYYFFKKKHNQFNFWTYILLKNDYKYQNKFLKNKFQDDFCIKREFWISANPALDYPVYSKNGNYAFSVVPENKSSKTESFIFVSLAFLFSIIAVFLFLWIFIRCYKDKRFWNNKKLTKATFLIALFILLRIVLFVFEIPSVFYQSTLFSPSIYASSVFLPSLGDLFLNVIFFAIISFVLFYSFRDKIKFEFKKASTKYLVAGSLVSFIFIFQWLIIYLINTLVFNSQLKLNASFINEVNLFNIVGILIIGGLFFSFYFISSFLLSIVGKMFKKTISIIFLYISVFLVFVLLWLLISIDITYLWMFLAVLPLILILNSDSNNQTSHNLSNLALTLFVFCMVSTLILISFYKEKELETMKTTAIKLSQEQDPIAEFMFSEMEEELFNDYSLMNLLARDPYDNAAISNYLQNNYFYDYWDKYDMQITVCTPYDNLLVRPANVEIGCYEFFENYIDDFAKPTISDNLIFLDNDTGRSSYLIKIPIELVFAKEWEEHNYVIFVELDSKFVPRDLGFPELLLDEGIELPEYLNNYSYAVYKYGKLINKFGPFFYSTNAAVYGDFKEEFTEFEFDSYIHLHFYKDAETELIISKPKESLLEKIAPFSYLFIMFFLLIIIYWVLKYDFRTILSLNLNFKNRLQVSMIGIVLISLISIVSVSAWFIYNIYQNKNEAFINEKAYSVLIEMEHNLMDVPVLDTEYQVYLNDLLLKLSNVFFTDINVYSSQGQLIASSRPSVFEEGLISELMNPEAYQRLKGHKQLLYVHHEKIGKLEFLSAYLPLRDEDNNVLAYINLPYFAKHGEFRSEIAHFLVAFINIYLLLLVLAIVIAFFVSNHITRPLKLLKDSISSMKLGAANIKIDWTKNDEIGQLVQEYNRMMDELATSAELLAQSERESAWREMAKQVAHEIKNPLTPMKLSVQYLDKAWKDKDPNWDERLKRFCVTMTEQIDNLSEIASAFSDFARMPVGKFTKLNLKEFIPEIIDLYKDFENTKINVTFKEENEMNVRADKKQMIRVFNNLIKNAIQAYDKKETAVIDILLYRENSNYVIEVKDYGGGIPEELRKNIFRPYFTTKTGGMGLGLAMVKSIIEGFGGSVGFYSEANKGSSFFVKMPVQ